MEAILDILYSFYGYYEYSSTSSIILAYGLTYLILGFLGSRLLLWILSTGVLLWSTGVESIGVWQLYVAVSVGLGIKIIRQYIVSYPILFTLKKLKILPKISETEQIALDAGTVWVEGELFSGKPNFNTILNQPESNLTSEEQNFLDTKVEKLCSMVNDWEVFQQRDFSDEIWAYIKKEGFLGLIIPKEFGGLGFSALANSTIIMKLASRSGPLGITCMVPNSLGPAELLIHYGTKEQQNYYLPRLAKGEDIPCFALTEPGAGSDAASMTSSGILFKNEKDELKIRLNWNKRWITLAAISTVIGLAFKLYDPEGLLGDKEDLGITCALIPADTPGVKLGRRHDPLGVPFYNSPTEGSDVIVSVDTIIGGIDNVGKGWRMLMESLAAGRGVSLPAASTGGAKLTSLVSSAFATVRKQFGVSIGKFEGIEDPLARIAGNTYWLDAARKYTCSAIDNNQQPSIVTAIMKYHSTEIAREIINDGMDILGGAAITRGPKNLLAHAYIGVPIGITVEGANILTRTLIIFGQGLIRCHPHIKGMVDGIETNNLKDFDQAFWSFQGHSIRNTIRATLLFLTRGWLTWSPSVSGVTKKYIRKLNWISATFAIYADIALLLFGGSLKMKEKVAGRFADILSYMYISSAVIKQFEVEGRPKEDKPFVEWSLQTMISNSQEAFEDILNNMGVIFKPIAWLYRVNSFGSKPSDKLSHIIAQLIQIPGDQRDRICDGAYVPNHDEEQLKKLHNAFEAIVFSAPIEKKIKKAIKKKELPKKPVKLLLEDAVSKNIISTDEKDQLEKAVTLQNEVIQVDSFTLDEYKVNV